MRITHANHEQYAKRSMQPFRCTTVKGKREREPSCTETTTHPPTVATARRHGKRWTKAPFNVDDDNADCQEVETATPWWGFQRNGVDCSSMGREHDPCPGLDRRSGVGHGTCRRQILANCVGFEILVVMSRVENSTSYETSQNSVLVAWFMMLSTYVDTHPSFISSMHIAPADSTSKVLH